MDVLDMVVAWDAATPALQNLSKVVNVFDRQGITRAQVEMHANLVWSTTTHGGAAKETPN
eukprot:11606017-Ditylum_brightwellii.AAC.1